MRTVDRQTVPVPAPLSDATRITEATVRYRTRTTQDPDGKIYASAEVKAALNALYHEKCSLCEAPASKDGVVEHFVPHSPQRAERAYDWLNLHWTCGKCNGRKRRTEYKQIDPGTGIVEGTLLIDPTAPPGGTVEAVLTFDGHFEARPVVGHETNDLVRLTAHFLNQFEPKTERSLYYRRLSDMLANEGCVPVWREIHRRGPLNPTTWPTGKLGRYRNAASLADRICGLFFADSSPFSRAMRSALTEGIGIPYTWLIELGRWHRSENAMPHTY
jgi:uncharacterized protein (TIGR02646 family)